MRTRKSRKGMEGQRFGQLVVLDASQPRMLSVKCDCGVVTTARIDHLREGRTVSCGCLKTQRFTTHGMSDTATYSSWESMKHRTPERALKGGA